MIVFIVGIYKSGTSMFTSVIEEMGLKSVVEDFRKESNVIGVKTTYNIRESYEVNLLNNDIIYSSNQNEMYFKTDNMPADINDSLKNRIREFYKKINYTGVIKDPRFIGTLNYWLKEIPSNIPYKIIWVDRTNINDIVQSFRKDKWFVSKINQSDTYENVIENLRSNLKKQYDIVKKGYWVDYDFTLKYQSEVLTTVYNYLISKDESYTLKKIYFASYFKPANEMKKLFSIQTPSGTSCWKNIIAVNTQEESDYVIVQDKTNDDLDEKKVIFFGREPKHVQGGFRDWSDRGAYARYHHEYGNSWLPQTWWINIPYDELLTLNLNKSKGLSIIDSGKRLTSYHNFRVDLINNITSKYKNVDLYGKINQNLLPERDKKDGLLDYKYNLAIENGITDFYFSEKICDPILCLTMPIYSGCKSIDKFFPKGSYYKIDESKSLDYISSEINDVINSNYREENIEQLKEARDLVLNKYNIWNTIYLSINNNKVL